ncbi:MAG: hypothetical protein WC497_03445 [Patescibacteria group bacterium]
MRMFWTMMVATATAALSYWVFEYWARWLHLADPQFIALSLVVTVVVHELAHWALFEIQGVPSLLIFGTFIGGAITLPDKKRRIQKLSWNVLAAIYLVGVMANLTSAVVFSVAGQFGFADATKASRMMNLVGQISVVNLLPVRFLDGGGFARVLFNSVPESRDMTFVRVIGLAVGLPVLVLAIGKSSTWLILIAFLLLGLQFFAKHDDPNGSASRLAMTERQQRGWAVCYTVCMLIGVLMLAFTRKWAVRLP